MSTVGGALAVTGTATGTGNTNTGITQQGAATAQTDTGMLTYLGTATGLHQSTGVAVDGLGTTVSSTSGDVLVTGDATSDQDQATGITLTNEAAVSAASNGAVTIEPVYCLGLCACGPAAMVDNKVVGRVDDAKMAKLLAEAGA